MELITAIRMKKGIELTPPDAAFCSAHIIPAHINHIRAAIILPEEKVRIHAAHIIEAIAPVNLRRALQIKDGDAISVTIE